MQPLNNNSVGASNLMVGNRTLLTYFPTKNILHDKNRTFSTWVSVVDFSAVGFLALLQTLKTQRQKNHVPV